MFTRWKWLLLAVTLSVMTFGLLTIGCITLMLIGALGVAYHHGCQKSLELRAGVRRRLETPSLGIPLVRQSMESTVKVKNFDKRMTGAAAMDAVLQEVLEYALRDYIKIWYRPLSDHDQFPVNVWQCAQKVVITFATRTKEIDWLPYFTSQMVDDFASHIRLYRRARDKVFMAKEGEEVTIESAFFDLEVEMENNICRDLVCMDPVAERQYLQDLSEVLLFLLLPPDDFKNKLFRYILREVLVNGVFLPMVDLFAQPDYINQNVSWMCKDTMLTNETFIYVIKTTVTEEELEAVKERVDQDIYRWRSKDTGGHDDVTVKQTLSSLLYVKATCEWRLRRLQGGTPEDDPQDASTSDQFLYILSIDDIISNNVAVQAFIEFLSSIGLQQYLFFYLNVDGYRAVAEQQAKLAEERVQRGGSRHWDIESLRQAATILYDQYLSDKATHRIRVDDGALKRVNQCIKKKLLTDSVFDEVQAEVYVKLHGDKFYEAFLQSNHYKRLLGDLDLLNDEESATTEDGSYRYLRVVMLSKALDGSGDTSDSVPEGSLDNNTCDEDSASVGSSSSCDPHPDGQTDELTDQQMDYTLTAQITNTGVGKEKLKTYTVFCISVKKTTPGQSDVETWDVFRRYSHFHDLHMIIYERYGTMAGHFFSYELTKCPSYVCPQYGSVAGLILPGKAAFRNMNKSFLDKRRKALDAYIQALLMSEMLQSHVGLFGLISKFLSPKPWEKLAHKGEGIAKPLRASIRQIGSVVKESSLDTFTSGFSNIFRLRSNSNAPRNSEKVGAGLDFDEGENIPLRILLLLMDEVFDVRHRNQWFRRRIVTILRQIINATYGEKINRKIVEQVDTLTSAEQMAEYVKNFRDAFWPGGILAEARPPRDDHTIMRTRVVCKGKMLDSIPEQLRHLMGSKTITQGVYQIFDMLQNKTLNKRIIYVLLEGMLQTMFPDNKFSDIFRKLHSKSSRVRPSTLPNDLKF